MWRMKTTRLESADNFKILLLIVRYGVIANNSSWIVEFFFCFSSFREEYENVAFVFVSDDMEWGRKNLKNEQVTIL